MKRVNVDGMLAAITQYANEYKKAVYDDVVKACEETGREIVTELKTSSPKDTGKYARGWRYTVDKAGTWARAIVHDTQYRLVHLLEYGHAKVNGGRTDARPHVDPAQSHADEVFLNKLRDRL